MYYKSNKYLKLNCMQKINIKSYRNALNINGLLFTTLSNFNSGILKPTDKYCFEPYKSTNFTHK